MKSVVLDIETVGDEPAMAAARHVDDGGFAPWPLHEVVCASMLVVERIGNGRYRYRMTSHSRATGSEAAIITEVEAEIADAEEVVTFNGRAFDVPVLVARATRFGIAAPTLCRLHGRGRPGLHADLMDLITGGRSASPVSLAQVCAPLGIPVKIDAGARVADLVAEGAWEAVERYCESDVAATWLAAQYWRWTEYPEVGAENRASFETWLELRKRTAGPRLVEPVRF